MIVTPILVAVLVQAIEPSLFALVHVANELVAELEDKCEHTNVQILVDELLSGHVFAFCVRREGACDCFRCPQDLVK